MKRIFLSLAIITSTLFFGQKINAQATNTLSGNYSQSYSNVGSIAVNTKMSSYTSILSEIPERTIATSGLNFTINAIANESTSIETTIVAPTDELLSEHSLSLNTDNFVNYFATTASENNLPGNAQKVNAVAITTIGTLNYTPANTEESTCDNHGSDVCTQSDNAAEIASIQNYSNPQSITINNGSSFKRILNSGISKLSKLFSK